MAHKVLTTLISLLFRAFLWGATLYHAGLILWAMIYTAQISDNLKAPALWGRYVDPSGGTSTSFQLYLAALLLNLAWETLSKPGYSAEAPFWLQDLGSGDFALIFWALFDGAARYSLKVGLNANMPDYLNLTLVLGLLLWAIQKLAAAALRKTWLSRRPNPATQAQAVPQKPVLRPPADHPVPPSSHEGGIQPSKQRPSKSGKRAQLQKDGQEKLLDFIGSKGKAQKSEIAEALGIPSRTVVRYVQKLVAEGRLEKMGENKDTAYRIKPDPRPVSSSFGEGGSYSKEK
jgi:hypothetical protein